MTTKDELKKAAAQEALQYIKDDMVVGVGTGSTVRFFIEALATMKHRIEGAIPSSKETEALLKEHHIPLCELNNVNELPIYVDGADEFNSYLWLVKGGGGALTREKILANNAKQFICIVDDTKQVDILGKFPLPIEVIPMARSYVARQIVKLGGDPVYREGFLTDNGNEILDVHNLDLSQPITMEEKLNHISGVVCNGIFARRGADIVLMGTANGVKVFNK